MSTSGSTNWSLNRDQVIKGALRKLAVLPAGATPTTSQVNDAAEALNAIVKVFQADGMPLWKISEYTWTLTSGTSVYSIGVGETLDTEKPLKVLQAFYTVNAGQNTPMRVENQYDFNNLPRTNVSGTPVILTYQPLNTTGVLSVWPTPSTSTTEITIYYQSPFEDMDAATDTFDFPSEWIQPLIYNLAWSLAPEYSIPPQDRNLLQKEATYWHEYVLSMGSEEGSFYIQPNRGN